MTVWLRWCIGVVVVLAMANAGCRNSPSASAPNTTSASDAGVEAAWNACVVGNLVDAPEASRVALERAGIDTAGMSDSEVVDAFIDRQRSLPEEAQLSEWRDRNRAGTEQAALAVRLDSQWNDLHEGFAAYAAYSEGQVTADAMSVDHHGLTQAGLACKRAKAQRQSA